MLALVLCCSSWLGRVVALSCCALLVACGGDESAPGSPDPAVAAECGPGGVELDDGCRQAGIDACIDGFAGDEQGGCTAVLPDAVCPRGWLALPGERSCRAVASCGDGTWGDIATDAATQHVDAAYAAGDSDGSAERPWTTMAAAIAAASPGAVVAVAAGHYSEDLLLTSKPVIVWGRCPELVELQGVGTLAAVFVDAPASGTVLRGLAISGPAFGVGLSGAIDIRIERAWVHDTAKRGVAVEAGAALTLSESLVEEASDVGVMAYEATVHIERSVIRATRMGAGNGRGVVARYGSELLLSGSLIELNHDHGVLVSGSTATIESSVVRDTLEQPYVIGGGIGVQRDSSSLSASAVSIRDAIVERNAHYGIFVEGSQAIVERTVVRDSQPVEGTVDFGAGIQAQGHVELGEVATVEVLQSVLERNRYAGVAAAGSVVTIESSIVRDTMPRWAGDYGRGVLLFYDGDTASSPQATLHGSVIAGNVEAGVFLQGGELTVDRTVIRDTAATPTGWAGRGINVQSDDPALIGSQLVLRDSLLEANHDLGLFVEGTLATLERTTIASTQPRPVDGLFGDGVHVDTLWVELPAEAAIEACALQANSRAGLAALGAAVTLASSSLSCNPIDLNGQDGATAFTISDLGGNECGCEGTEKTCKISAAELEPPQPMDQ